MLTRHRIQVVIVYLRRHLWLIPAGVVIIAAAIVVPVKLTAGPSYPHSWCAETLTAMYGSHGTFGDFMNKLRDARNNGAPTDNLIDDEDALSQDQADASTAPVTDALTILAAESSDMTSISNDAKAINRACGKPANYKIGRLAVPSSD